MTGLLVLLVTLALATAAGSLYRARNGRIRTTATPAVSSGGPVGDTSPDSSPDSTPDLRPDLVDLGFEPGERGTLLQFSSAFCAPCRATRRLLADVGRIGPRGPAPRGRRRGQ